MLDLFPLKPSGTYSNIDIQIISVHFWILWRKVQEVHAQKCLSVNIFIHRRKIRTDGFLCKDINPRRIHDLYLPPFSSKTPLRAYMMHGFKLCELLWEKYEIRLLKSRIWAVFIVNIFILMQRKKNHRCISGYPERRALKILIWAGFFFFFFCEIKEVIPERNGKKCTKCEFCKGRQH